MARSIKLPAKECIIMIVTIGVVQASRAFCKLDVGAHRLGLNSNIVTLSVYDINMWTQPGDWFDVALNGAVSAWNSALQGQLTLQIATKNDAANYRLNLVYESQGIGMESGVATVPSEYTIDRCAHGFNIDAMINYQKWEDLGVAQQLFVTLLTHELGHMLGLAHESGPGSSSAWRMTSYDPGSVMHAQPGTRAMTWVDADGLYKLYSTWGDVKCAIFGTYETLPIILVPTIECYNPWSFPSLLYNKEIA